MKTQLKIQFLQRPPTDAFPSRTPITIYITFPVNNSEPASTTSIKPTGNTAPNTNLDNPRGHPAANIPEFATSANNPPNAIYAPAKNESKITFRTFAELFVPPIEETVFAVSTGLLKLININLSLF